MNESHLFEYALLACIIGFFLLGFVVLFVPITFDDDSHNYIDGEVLALYPTDSGMVIKIKEQKEVSLFIEKNNINEANISTGNNYRFYDPIIQSTKEDSLIQITALRKLH